METLFIDTFIGVIKLVHNYNDVIGLDYYNVYSDSGRYIGDLWSANIGYSLEMDLKDFLIEKGY